MAESYTGKINRKLTKKQRIIRAAAGTEIADLVLKHANYVSVFSGEVKKADIAIAEGLIVGIGEYSGREEIDMSDKIVCPGLLDAHIHLESALVKPAEFAKAVISHGTTSVITDPHEIANVMGTDGIEYMLQATEDLPVDVRFMLPSCVPSTPLDESGAVLDYRAIDSFYEHPRVQGLAEVMDYQGVIGAQETCVEKIVAAQAHHKKIDGHAPGLTGNALNAYISAGVYSDHECASFEEALEKLERGQMIMIREGTAARNLEALLPLLTPKYEDRCMLCTDDKHPSDLLTLGHMDDIIRKAIRGGVDPIIAIKAATHNPARYFLLNNRGAIANGYRADFAIVDSLEDFSIDSVYVKGALMYEKGKAVSLQAPVIDPYLEERANRTFQVKMQTAEDYMTKRPRGVIGLVDGEIITKDEGYAEAINVSKDILKIAVVERHKGTGHVGVGYLKGYGLQSGAVATSISHDSHNIIVVGTSEEEMAFAANEIIREQGGIVVTKDQKVVGKLKLPIAGIMSDAPLDEVNRELEDAKAAAYAMGVNPNIDPFMTLSFLGLPVIPEIRLTTRGIFDVVGQTYI